jgi:TPR repeat protein
MGGIGTPRRRRTRRAAGPLRLRPPYPRRLHPARPLADRRALPQQRPGRRALALFRRACNDGDAAGCDEASRAAEEGRGMIANQGQADQLAEQACRLGFARACLRLGDRFERGVGTFTDPARSAAFYQLGCDRNEANSCVRLGKQYEEGRGVRGTRTGRSRCTGRPAGWGTTPPATCRSCSGAARWSSRSDQGRKSFASNRSPTVPSVRSTALPRSRNRAGWPPGPLASTALLR